MDSGKCVNEWQEATGNLAKGTLHLPVSLRVQLSACECMSVQKSFFTCTSPWQQDWDTAHACRSYLTFQILFNISATCFTWTCRKGGVMH